MTVDFNQIVNDHAAAMLKPSELTRDQWAYKDSRIVRAKDNWCERHSAASVQAHHAEKALRAGGKLVEVAA